MRAIHVETHLEAALFTVEVEAPLAIIATPTAGDARDGDPVPHLKTFHPFPDLVDAGLRAGKLGRSSVRYEIGLFRAGGELLLAAAARDAGVPYILSGASIATIEAVARVAAGRQSPWKRKTKTLITIASCKTPANARMQLTVAGAGGTGA